MYVSVAKRCCCKVSPVIEPSIGFSIVFQLLSDVVVKCRHKSHTLLIEQLEEFPEGEHDDAPDSLHGAYKLSKLEKSKNKKKKRTNRIIRKRPGVMDD